MTATREVPNPMYEAPFALYRAKYRIQYDSNNVSDEKQAVVLARTDVEARERVRAEWSDDGNTPETLVLGGFERLEDAVIFDDD